MRWRATVRIATGKTTHLRGDLYPEGIGVTKLPDPQAVEVVERDGGFYLLRLDNNGECIADTWHESLDAAREQANFEYGIEEGDWIDVELRQ